MHSYKTGALLVIIAGVIWSLMGLAIRNIEAASAWQILLYRSAGMVPVLLTFVAIRSGGRPLQQIARTGWAGIVGALGLLAAFAGAIIALQATTVANAVFLFAAAPFLTALLAWALLGEQVRPATRAAIAIAAVGVIIMVREGLSGGAAAGNIAALISALGFAAFTVTLRWGKLEDMVAAVLLGALVSMLAAALMLVWSGTSLRVSLWDGALSAAMGAVLLSGGMVLYTFGSRAVPAAETALLSMLEILLAPLWVWLFLGETATATTFAGGAVLLVAVAFNAISGARVAPA